jgi:hypothetical protein
MACDSSRSRSSASSFRFPIDFLETVELELLTGAQTPEDDVRADFSVAIVADSLRFVLLDQ